MCINAIRASRRHDGRLNWSGSNVEPLPQGQDVPFNRVVPAAEKERFRQSTSVFIPRVEENAVGSFPGASLETKLSLNRKSFRGSEVTKESREYSYSA